MHLDQPRIPALPPDSWSDRVRALMQPYVDAGQDYNILRTLMNHPRLSERWLVFANYVLQESTLSDRARELAILRVGHLCGAEYEWREHSEIARKLGIDEAGIESARTGSETPGLPDADRVLFMAAEELHRDTFITDRTWAGLQEHFSTEEIMDLVFTVGQYHLVSMALNSFGVQFES